ncbi:MAG: ABC transporter permease, partial [Cytophagales bacterium CG18_big_fil_WC_8_21_14_2_50_42_9]
MLYNYLKIAFRNLAKQKFYSGINILGLTLGIACCLLIFLFVQHELSYDTFHAKAKRIFRVQRVDYGTFGKIPYVSGPYGPALAADFPDDVKATVRVMKANGLLSYGDKSFNEYNLIYADSNFFQVFTFPLVQGNATTALASPNTLVLSKSLAKKYFGSENPVGKLMTMDKTDTYQVTGVMADVPSNSHLKFDLITSIQPVSRQEGFNVWRNNSMFTYVLLANPNRVKNLEAKFPAFMDKYLGEAYKTWGGKMGLALEPLTDIYLNSGSNMDNAEHGSRSNVYIFSAIAVFILVIACINFMNLASARSVGRAKEVGVRKVLGAYKNNLITQFLSESTLLTFISVLLAVLLIILVLPYFNALAEKSLAVPFTNPLLYVFLVGIALVVGLLAGSYPAFFLSSFQPVKVLKGHLSASAGNPVLRQALVVFQFSISIFLIVGTMVIFRQMAFMQNKNLGFNKDQVITIPLDNSEIYSRRQTFINQVKQLSGVKNVSVMSGEPGGFHDRYTFDIADKPGETWNFRTVFTDVDYVPAFAMKLAAGRNFSKSFPTDSTAAIMLNETAVKNLGWSPQEAIGKEIMDKGLPDSIKYQRKVVGVVKDYHFSSLRETIAPLAILMRNDHRVIAVRLASGNPKPILTAIEKVYAATAPQYPFAYSFLDEEFASQYKTEQKQGQVLTIFSVLAIFIACLGLFGLASYTTEQRRKEIG